MEYAKYLDSHKTMSFKFIDKKLKYGKNGILIGRNFDNEPVYSDNGKYRKIKRKSYGDKVNTNF